MRHHSEKVSFPHWKVNKPQSFSGKGTSILITLSRSH